MLQSPLIFEKVLIWQKILTGVGPVHLKEMAIRVARRARIGDLAKVAAGRDLFVMATAKADQLATEAKATESFDHLATEARVRPRAALFVRKRRGELFPEKEQ